MLNSPCESGTYRDSNAMPRSMILWMGSSSVKEVIKRSIGMRKLLRGSFKC